MFNREIAKTAEEWIGMVAWMSRVNRQVEVDTGRMVWELLARPSMKYAAEVWWTGGRSACRVVTDENGYDIVGGKQFSSRNGSAGRSRVEEAGEKEGRDEGELRWKRLVKKW